MESSLLRSLSAFAFLCLAACGGDSSSTDEAQGIAPGDLADAASVADAAVLSDAAPVVDAGTVDAAPIDAGPIELQEGECRSEEDCPKFELCFAPGQFIGCGICNIPLNPCDSDADCTGEGEICDAQPQDCLCEGKTCRPGCTADSCSVGESCGADGHCAPTSCSSAADCPGNFDCGGDTCVRRSCNDDGACDAGSLCVGGQCQDEPGSCSAIPA